MTKTLAAAAACLLIATGAAPAADPLSELAWIAGDWYGTSDGVEMEERWTEPRGGLMLGVHRDVKGGKAISFEFLRIESGPKGIAYISSPGGQPPTPFPLVESKGKRVVFANPQHDFPKRILYWMTDDGLLHARIEGEPGDKEHAMEWAWRKGRP